MHTQYKQILPVKLHPERELMASACVLYHLNMSLLLYDFITHIYIMLTNMFDSQKANYKEKIVYAKPISDFEVSELFSIICASSEEGGDDDLFH